MSKKARKAGLPIERVKVYRPDSSATIDSSVLMAISKLRALAILFHDSRQGEGDEAFQRLYGVAYFLDEIANSLEDGYADFEANWERAKST